MCRICLEEGGDNFCGCKGSCGQVHAECLQKWIDISQKNSCEICLQEYIFPKVFKCRFHLKISDLNMGKNTNTSVLCCIFGFCIFMINFGLSIILKSFIINIISSNIISTAFTCLITRYTNSLQLYIYLSTIIALGNILVIIELDSLPFYTFCLQWLITILLIFTWIGRITWRSSWIVSTISNE